MAYADAMIVLYPGAIVFEVMLAAELLAAFGAVRAATAAREWRVRAGIR